MNLTIGEKGLITKAKESQNYMTNAVLSDKEAIDSIFKDTTPPKIKRFEAINITYNSIEVIVEAEEEQYGSGLATEGTYTYEVINGEKQTSTNNTCIFSENITEDTTYTIKVEVRDKEGNIASQTITVKTKKQIKTVEQLYDGINDDKNANYNENAMHIGDYVNYDAGTWEETRTATSYGFGGYTKGQSRNTNASGSYGGFGNYSGWRIWDVSADKKYLFLVSAGCPEVFNHKGDRNTAYNVEKIFTGSTTESKINTAYPSTPRDCSSYINESQHAIRAMLFKTINLSTWYKTNIDGTVNNITDMDMRRFPSNTQNKLISTVNNGFNYWLGNYATGDSYVYIVDKEERYMHYTAQHTMGVRIIVTIGEGAKFEGKPEKINQDGFTYNKWIFAE